METPGPAPFEPRLREEGGKREIFDPVRKKFVALTPEEWVRQHTIHFLATGRGVPVSLMAVEVSLRLHSLQKRADIVVYNKKGEPRLIVECKAPEVKITPEVFQQIAAYNMTLKVPFLVVTNGSGHYACRIDHEKRSYGFLPTIPAFEEIE
jgi:type I site-specific restriction endonuclease